MEVEPAITAEKDLPSVEEISEEFTAVKMKSEEESFEE